MSRAPRIDANAPRTLTSCDNPRPRAVPWAPVDRTKPTSGAELTLAPEIGHIDLTIRGELDLATAARLTDVLNRLERAAEGIHLGPVHLALGAVSFADSDGLAPLLDSAERRHDAGLPRLGLTAASRPVLRLLGLLRDEPSARALIASQTS